MIGDLLLSLMDFWVCDGVMMGIAPLVAAAAIGAVVSIGSAIYGGISAHKQKKKQMAHINAAQRENRAWYNRRYNEDATQRADAQRMLTMANEAIRKRTMAAAGRKAVVGGTDATLAATQEANAAAIGNAVSAIAVEGERRKDAVEASYRARQQQLEDQKFGVASSAEEAKRANTAAAATGALNTVANVIASNGSGSGDADATGAAKVKGGGANDATKKTLNMVTPEDPWTKAKRTPVYGSDSYWA